MTPAKSKLAACAIGLAIAGNCFGNGSALAQDGATRDVTKVSSASNKSSIGFLIIWALRASAKGLPPG